MANALMNKLNRELNKLEKEVELATSYIPDGYKVAKDTLSEQVKAMAAKIAELRYNQEQTMKKLTNTISRIRVDNMGYSYIFY